MPHLLTTGLASVNGVDVYWESRGDGGNPLVVVSLGGGASLRSAVQHPTRVGLYGGSQATFCPG
jgi:hypothetical protein